jgi:hypothetical protein
VGRLIVQEKARRLRTSVCVSVVRSSSVAEYNLRVVVIAFGGMEPGCGRESADVADAARESFIYQ